MTPEERAARALPPGSTGWEYGQLVRAVAAAIHEATVAEREACARLAAVMGMPPVSQSDALPPTAEQHAKARLAARIATAIKARSDE